jgi:hypothetical protein
LLGLTVALPLLARGQLPEALENYTMPTCRVECASQSLEAFGGYLLGFNNGEWGGSLAHLDSHGSRRELIGENVVGLYRLTAGVVVITGLAHMGLQYGRIYSIIAGGEGKVPAVRLLHDLEGAPATLRQRSSGEIDVRIYTRQVEWSADAKVGRPVPICRRLEKSLELGIVSCADLPPDEHPPTYFRCSWEEAQPESCPPLNR